MALRDLTDRSAVLQAINEFRELGEDAFLEKYGFERSRRIQIAYEGETFPSKAILGAAHGFQFPDAGPLRAVGVQRRSRDSRQGTPTWV